MMTCASATFPSFKCRAAALGEQSKLRRQRQLRLGFGFMLLLHGDQARSGGNQRKNSHDASDEGQHAHRATAYALLGSLRALDVIDEIGLGVRAMLAQETLSIDQVELGEKSGFATRACTPGRESRAQCYVALALAGSVPAGFLEPAPQRVAFLDAAADLEGSALSCTKSRARTHRVMSASWATRTVGAPPASASLTSRRASEWSSASTSLRCAVPGGNVDSGTRLEIARSTVAVGRAHLDQSEQHRTERLTIVGRAALQYGVRPGGNRALQPAEPLVGRKGQGGALGFKHIAAIELIEEIGEQRQCSGFVGDLLCDDLVERHVGRRMVFEADTRRGCGTPDHLAQLRLSGRQELEPPLAFRHVYELGRVVGLVPEILAHRGDDPHATRAHETGNQSDEALPFERCQELVREQLLQLIEHEYESRRLVLQHAAILPCSDRKLSEHGCDRIGGFGRGIAQMRGKTRNRLAPVR
jgi:hypothetical protein